MLKAKNLLITVYCFAIVTDHAIPTASVNMNKEVTNSADVNRDLGMNQADSELLCINSSYKFDQLLCTPKGPKLRKDYCMTYNENTKIMSVYKCPYFRQKYFNTSNNGFRIELPTNLSQLNNFMMALVPQ